MDYTFYFFLNSPSFQTHKIRIEESALNDLMEIAVENPKALPCEAYPTDV